MLRLTLTLLLGCIVGGIVALLMARQPRASNTAISTSPVFDSVPLDIVSDGVPPKESEDRSMRVWTMWSKPSYSGDMTPESVKSLIAMGKGDSLESRLSVSRKAQLDVDIAANTQRIKDAAYLMHVDEQRILKEAARDPALATVVVGSSSPVYKQMEERRADLAKSDQGLVLSFANPSNHEEVTFVTVLWRDHPQYHSLRQSHQHACIARQAAVRRWIAKLYSEVGMAAFE